MTTIKGPGSAKTYDGSPLRIAIIHARWNATIISALVTGARNALLAAGVLPTNITTQSVPGSWELPLAVRRAHAASQPGAGATLLTADLLLGSDAATAGGTGGGGGQQRAFDAVIAVGVLIKGQTMHFEYIADGVAHGLMRVQMEAQVPVVFGLLTVLSEEQAEVRAGLRAGEGSAAHNHGEDWGRAAVELGVKARAWAEGVFLE